MGIGKVFYSKKHVKIQGFDRLNTKQYLIFYILDSTNSNLFHVQESRTNHRLYY